MMNKSVLSVFGFMIGGGALVLAGGMDTDLANYFGEKEPARVTVAAGAATQGRAEGMRLELFACGAETPAETVHIPFQGGSLGEFSSFVDMPVDTGADHEFSAMSWQLGEGCYYVTAQPVGPSKEALSGCSTARTPHTFVDAGQSQRLALISSCDSPEAGGIEVAGDVNHAPTVADVMIDEIGGGHTCDTIEVCATARDPDGDPMTMHWQVNAEKGRPLHLPAPRRTERRGRLTECVELTPGKGQWQFEVSVRDQVEDGGRFVTFEDAYVARHGLVADSRDTVSFDVDADCTTATCPKDPKERITDIKYWITRDGRLLSPTDNLEGAKPGDMVDVEFDVAPGCSGTQVTFASYTGKDRAEQASVFSRTYDAGTHLLWNVLPDCEFVADLHLGPAVSGGGNAGGDNPYGERLIDSFAGGEAACSGK